MAKRFPGESTWVGKVKPEDLTAAEKADIQAGVLGYCEGHGVLYKKRALDSCLVPLIFTDGLGRACKEWPLEVPAGGDRP